jgi:pimeloyl-ACP methyl ester carboxylesterase
MWRMAGYPAGLGDRQVILMDHRGHGASERPRTVEEHRIDRYVEDVVAVADDLGLATFSFFGYSAGASVGYRLAATRPERVDALVGLGAVGPQESNDDDDDGVAEIAGRVRMHGSGELVTWLREEETDIPGWFEDQMRSTDPEMFALTIEARATWAGLWSEFPSVRCPTLLIVGETEEPDAGENASRAAALMGDGRAVVLPGLGHVAAFVRSDLVIPHVRAFLDGLAH